MLIKWEWGRAELARPRGSPLFCVIDATSPLVREVRVGHNGQHGENDSKDTPRGLLDELFESHH